jgi:hypothetical protein
MSRYRESAEAMIELMKSNDFGHVHPDHPASYFMSQVREWLIIMQDPRAIVLDREGHKISDVFVKDWRDCCLDFCQFMVNVHAAGYEDDDWRSYLRDHGGGKGCHYWLQ